MGSVDEGIAAAPADDRAALQRVVDLARRIAPEATDGVSYGMPALRVAGRPYVAVQHAAKHLSLYPFSPAAIDAVRTELGGFDVSKGTVRFTRDHQVPDEVLERLLRARLAEIEARPR